MAAPGNIVCVILAGGQGKRMASAGLHKVCFPILGRPAIIRAINTYKKAGLRRFLLVVGQMAGQVIATVTAEHPEVCFVHQSRPRGTGHAALVAAEALAAQDYHGPAMVTMGDKITQPKVVRALMEKFQEADADIVLSTLPKSPDSTAGRVVTDSQGKVLGIVESADVEKARRTGRKLRLAGRALSARQVEKQSSCTNASMYLCRFEALQSSLRRLDIDNAQQEMYLTDVVEDLAIRGGAQCMLVDDPSDLMAYNTPAELLAIEEVLRRRETPPRVTVRARKRLPPSASKPAGGWLKMLEGDVAGCARALRRIYGPEESLIEERRRRMARLVGVFARRFGHDRGMILCRAPGRINLMGRHVDHRGGCVNVMGISREVLLAAAPRRDNVVALENLQGRLFPPRQFRISDMLSEASWTDWLDFVASQTVRGVLESAPGDWSHYARAPLIRLQHECPQAQLRGMDCLVAGDIPMGAGLSSSSAMVVAFAEAAVALNGLHVTTSDFVDLCGEGEWFVGSRGGSADHAAIRSSRRGYISRIGFFPFHLQGEVRFPRGLHVVIAHSGAQAVKSAAAGRVFNQRVACYEIAQMLLRRRWPAAAGAEHLRDLVPDRLKVRDAEIYRGLLQLPNRPSRAELRRMFPPEDHQHLERLFATHGDLGPYDLRGVVMYGIGECIRSERFAAALERGDLDQIGKAMRTSHDGDRRMTFDADGNRRTFLLRTDDATLRRLAEANAPLVDQPGRYACSTEAIDQLVDIARGTEGVIGAQLAGAGLGGCMMILVRAEALDGLLRRLRKGFYRPRGIGFDVHVCVPVAGADLVRL